MEVTKNYILVRKSSTCIFQPLNILNWLSGDGISVLLFYDPRKSLVEKITRFSEAAVIRRWYTYLSETLIACLGANAKHRPQRN